MDLDRIAAEQRRPTCEELEAIARDMRLAAWNHYVGDPLGRACRRLLARLRGGDGLAQETAAPHIRDAPT